MGGKTNPIVMNNVVFILMLHDRETHPSVALNNVLRKPKTVLSTPSANRQNRFPPGKQSSCSLS
jgi:hypothetical protein